VDSNKFARYKAHNRCAKRWGYPIKQLCEDRPDCTSKCSFCSRCNKVCPDFDEQVCDRLYSPLYVCDGCFKERQCVMRKKYYLHKQAHEAYREALTESRSGASITEDELIYLDNLVSPLIKQGQSGTPHLRPQRRQPDRKREDPLPLRGRWSAPSEEHRHAAGLPNKATQNKNCGTQS